MTKLEEGCISVLVAEMGGSVLCLWEVNGLGFIWLTTNATTHKAFPRIHRTVDGAIEAGEYMFRDFKIITDNRI